MQSEANITLSISLPAVRWAHHPDAHALLTTLSVAVSIDGRSAYAASLDSDAVARLHRAY